MSETDRFLKDVKQELKRARAKFPSAHHAVAALMEEVGELANAILEFDYGNEPVENIRSEAIQVAAMAVRVAVDGDTSFKYPRALKQAIETVLEKK